MDKKAELIKAALILPGTVAVLIPAVLLYADRPVYFLGGALSPGAVLPLAIAMILITGGLMVAVKTVKLFFTVGDGTPAPWAPPRRFVVQGPYAHVRNPMLLAVLGILLGEAVLFASFPLFVWWALFWIVNTFYLALFEERDLEQRFGHDYVRYKQHVRRWLPRFKPWTP